MDAMWCIDYLIKLLRFTEIIEIDVFFTACLMKLLGFIEMIEVNYWCVFLQLC